MDSRYNGYSDDGRIDTHTSVVPYSPNTPTHRQLLGVASQQDRSLSRLPPPTTNRLTPASGDYSRGRTRSVPEFALAAGSSFHGSGIESDSLYRETTKKQDDLHFAYSQNITPPRICQSV